MHTRSIRRFMVVVFLALFAPAGCSTGRHSDDPRGLMPPAPKREFRAAWVATVGNIDWPSKKGLSVERQQAEIIDALDKALALNMNAIVLQVRTSCDAFYPSEYEPWSEFLTGKQGQAPEPFYDPLQMWVEEAHKRGLELHAWFNPYRARTPGAKTPNAPNHISQTNPDVVKSFGGYEWLDPGEQAAQDLTYNVFLDVVRRYDVDGIHIDDYFYPYPDYLKDKKTGKTADFPDEPSWQRYADAGGTLSREDWRRDNVDRLVRRIYEGIKQTKPHVKFGISPFGISKPGNPPTVKSSFSQYDSLYADAKLWLNRGWCDYYTPQLYWRVNSDQPYRDLVEWWTNENTKGRNLWPGLYTSKVLEEDREKRWSPHDIVDQILVTRETPGATGHVHFSMKALTRRWRLTESDSEGDAAATRAADTQPAATQPADTQPATRPTTGPTTRPSRTPLVDALTDGPYAEPALVPASPWLDGKRPAAPRFKVSRVDGDGEALNVTWKPAGREPAQVWAVFARHNVAWKTHVVPGDTHGVLLRPDPVLGPVTAASVAAVDRAGNISATARAKKPGERTLWSRLTKVKH